MGIFSNIVYKDGEIVDNSWIKWIHFGVPDEEGAERELKRRSLAAALHCLCCTALSGCYFASNNKPEKHPNCDCGQKTISKPKNESRATCDIRKFTEYIFDERYRNKGKNKLFALLGFLKEDSVYLQSEYEKQAKEKYTNGNYILGKLDKYGQRINITINVSTATHTGIKLVSGWLVHPLGLITCTTPLGG